MLRTFFATFGVLFAALLLFSASFLGNVAVDLEHRRDEYGAMAVDATRELSRTWKLSAIEHHYTADGRQELSPVLDADLDGLQPLGALLHADNIRIQPHWSHAIGRHWALPGEAAERLAALINRTVSVSFTGAFAGGLAEVTVELRREGSGIKLWQLKINSRQKPRPQMQPERHVISHA